MAVGIPVFVENILAVIVLLRCRNMIVQIRTLLLNLSIADCMTGLVLTVPDYAYELVFHCRIKKYLAATIVFGTFFIISLLNLDRCLALFFGIRYYMKVTAFRVRLSCVSAWFLAVVNSYLMYFDPSEPTGIYCSMMFSSPHNFGTAISRASIMIFAFINIAFLGFMLYMLPKQATSRVLSKMALITGFALVCYTPALLLHAFFPMEDNYYRRLIAYTGVLLFSNSIFNPILYVWRFKEARHYVTRIFCFWNKKYLEKCDKDWKFQTATFDICCSNSVQFDRSA
ncbi:C-C chemokine receptor type 5-like [Saccostrea echinata]|uniref:C-C chemokine receptor type 5-like n=1 Tax=Saccostrea echinata TaxID=191078 RepID=UPI002A812161|nr:C-C chemokine receptor type 5-like [Saccostrea echinata]